MHSTHRKNQDFINASKQQEHMTKSRGLAISCLLIFISFAISIWLYNAFSMLHGLETSTAEMEKAVACLRHGFTSCTAGDQVRQLISYRFLSIDKIFLVVLSIIAATAIIKLTIDDNPLKAFLRNLCILASFLFALFIVAQYASLTLKLHTWDYLQHSWADQSMDIIKDNCIKGISVADCGLAKKWLNIAHWKTMIIHILSLLLLGAVSIFAGTISRNLLHKSNAN